eukprot:2778724-Pyramimonas_sp.AAC.1
MGPSVKGPLQERVSGRAYWAGAPRAGAPQGKEMLFSEIQHANGRLHRKLRHDARADARHCAAAPAPPADIADAASEILVS